ncbi:gag/pol protein [Cucumis melo var. makuwa]|uniref:Gag/pol protein n=1 Tax=Cucumis melo var. makuwa TaxID=1194695 RepID=A0A5A7VBR5_CUCMM|nr:gag/pol protein [Cucumis melo var. makuwa]
MNKIAYTLSILLNELQNFEPLMKIKGQKGETNIATSTRKFYRGSTSGTKSVPSSSDTKKWKKKKGGQGNKANPTAAKTSKKGISFWRQLETVEMTMKVGIRHVVSAIAMGGLRLLQTAAYILNCVPFKSVSETPLKLWNGHKGYPKGTRGGYFYDPKDNKVFVSTNATFLEEDHIREHKPRSKIVLNELSNETTEPSTRVVEDPSGLTRVFHHWRIWIKMIKAMNLELKSMYFNSIWDLVDQHDGHGVNLFKEQCPKTPQVVEEMRHIPYASTIGSFMYVMICTRPDICYADTQTLIFKLIEILGNLLQAEYVVACEPAKEAIWLRKFLIDLEVGPNMSKPITLYYDNNGVVANSREPKSHKHGRHIECKYHLI